MEVFGGANNLFFMSMSALLLFLFGVGIGWKFAIWRQIDSNKKHELEQIIGSGNSQEAFFISLKQFVQQVIPEWSAQIIDAQLNLKKEVTNLKFRFYHLADNLDSSEHNQNATFQQAIVGQPEKEQHLIRSIRGSFDLILLENQITIESVKMMLGSLQNMINLIGEMGNMTKELSSFADQIHIQALSAAIEADRRSTHSINYLMLTDDVGKLASLLCSVSEQIDANVYDFNNAIKSANTTVIETKDCATNNSEHLKKDIEKSLDQLQSLMTQLKNTNQLLVTNNDIVKKEISESMLAFQLQEDVIQSLVKVNDSIWGLLVDPVKSDTLKPLNIAAMLERLQRSAMK